MVVTKTVVGFIEARHFKRMTESTCFYLEYMGNKKTQIGAGRVGCAVDYITSSDPVLEGSG